MTANIFIYEDSDAKIGARLALDHKLYVCESWQLKGRLMSVAHGARRVAVALAFKGDEPHAVVLLRLDRGYEDVAAYTKKMSRYEGLASACIKALREYGYTFPHAGAGINGSEHFWYKNQIKCVNTGHGDD